MDPPSTEFLSPFRDERDNSALLVIKDVRKVAFVEDEPSPDKLDQIEEWNDRNQRLLS
jgi:hypothetical protein